MWDVASLLAAFLTAYLAVDYIIRPLWLSGLSRKKGGWLLLALLHGFAAYIFIGLWQAWFVIPLIAFLNSIFSAVICKNWRSWASREILRFLVFGGVCILFMGFFEPDMSATRFIILALLGGGAMTVFWIGEFVGQVVDELALQNKLEWRGLENGGLWIGRLERLLIFIFIFMNSPAGIGFLVAAKSILRFSETREDQRMAEYVLIGTLLSFSLAILTALLTQKVIALFVS